MTKKLKYEIVSTEIYSIWVPVWTSEEQEGAGKCTNYKVLQQVWVIYDVSIVESVGGAKLHTFFLRLNFL